MQHNPSVPHHLGLLGPNGKRMAVGILTYWIRVFRSKGIVGLHIIDLVELGPLIIPALQTAGGKTKEHQKANRYKSLVPTMHARCNLTRQQSSESSGTGNTFVVHIPAPCAKMEFPRVKTDSCDEGWHDRSQCPSF